MIGVCVPASSSLFWRPVTTHLGGHASAPTVLGDWTQQQQLLHSTGSQAKLRPLGDAEMPPSQVPSVHCLLHHRVYQAS